MLPDRVSNPGPLTYESGALPIALRGPCKGDQICDSQNRNKLFKGKIYSQRSKFFPLKVYPKAMGEKKELPPLKVYPFTFGVHVSTT